MRRWTPLLALLVACASGSEATRTATASGSASTGAGGPTLYDRLGRPSVLCEGTPIRAVLS